MAEFEIAMEDHTVTSMKEPVRKPATSQPCSSRQHAAIPKASTTVYLVLPQSKYSSDIVRANAKQKIQCRQRMKHLKSLKEKPLQAAKPSAKVNTYLPDDVQR
ncbi:hypothetical protein DITRI_Ditri01bG0173400 [Diplodiscus trichospermus]